MEFIDFKTFLLLDEAIKQKMKTSKIEDPEEMKSWIGKTTNYKELMKNKKPKSKKQKKREDKKLNRAICYSMIHQARSK